MARKIREARALLNLSQTQLAKKVGITSRSIQAYELNEKRPRPGTLLRLSKALHVSIRYLCDDKCDDPLFEIRKDRDQEMAYHFFTLTNKREIKALIDASVALMYGDDIDLSQKKRFFDALQIAYVDSIRNSYQGGK